MVEKNQKFSSESTILASWERFKEAFPDEAACRAAVIKGALESGALRCPNCASVDIASMLGRVARCAECKFYWSVTSRTWWANTRERFEPRLAALHFTEEGVLISSSRFAKLLNIAYSTAWGVMDRIKMLIGVPDHECSKAILSSALSSSFCRRSRETPARSHPIAEQTEVDKNNFSEDVNQRASGGNTDIDSEMDLKLTADEIAVQEIFDQKPIGFDALVELSGFDVGRLSAALMMLELNGLVRRLPGDSYERIVSARHFLEGPLTETERNEIKIMIDLSIDWLKKTFGGISRKYVQLYVALLGFLCDRKKRATTDADWSLLKKSFSSKQFTTEDILAFISPAVIRFSPIG